MELLEMIKHVRTNKKVSQAEMADKLGMAQNNYGKIERGITELTIQRLYQIAEILEVNIEVLMGLFMDTSFTAEKEKYKEKDKEIEDLKKRVAELEDRVKDKESLRLNLEKEFGYTNSRLAGWIYSYTYGLVKELDLPFFNSTGYDLDLIPILQYGIEDFKVFFSYNSEDFEINNPKKGLYPVPFLKSENIKEAIHYGFKKEFHIISQMFSICLPCIKDERFVNIWNEVLDELVNQEKRNLKQKKGKDL